MVSDSQFLIVIDQPIVKLQVSVERKHFSKFEAFKYAEVLIGKINASIWFHCMKKEED